MSKLLLKSILASAAGVMLAVSCSAQAKSENGKSLSRSVATINAGRNANIGRSVSDIVPEVTSDLISTYHIGVGDTLRIQIKNIPGPPVYAKVLPDGRIDFPLAGQDLAVAGETIDKAERLIAASIKLIKNPQVTLTVSNFSSHTVSFWGLVNQPGERQIQRDAVPLYVIRAMAGVERKAKWARITRRKSTKTIIVPLGEASFDQLLVYPGDSIVFTD